jgi:enoyl-[acyl-carrier protein] reductase I
MAKLAEPLVKDGGTLSTMTCHGSQVIIEHYNMMGPVKAAEVDHIDFTTHEGS